MVPVFGDLRPALLSFIMTSIVFLFREDLSLPQSGIAIPSSYEKGNISHPYCGYGALSGIDTKALVCSFQRHNEESTLFLGENELMRTRDSIRFHRNVPSLCEFDVDLLVVIISTVGAYDNRKTIRETWKIKELPKDDKSRVKIVFFIPTKSDKDERQTRDESEEYKDIIQVQLYERSTTAVLLEALALTWFRKYCFNAMFYLKTNDRVVLNLAAVQNVLLSLAGRPDCGTSIFGKVLENIPVLRSGPRSTCEFFYPFDTYPNYMSEETYLMRRDVVLKLDEGIKHSFFFPLPDVYVSGMTASLVNVSLINTNKVIENYSDSFWKDNSSLGYIASDRNAMQEHWKKEILRTKVNVTS